MILNQIIKGYNLWPLIHKEFILVQINKGTYGLPQAGYITYEKLKTNMKKEDAFLQVLIQAYLSMNQSLSTSV